MQQEIQLITQLGTKHTEKDELGLAQSYLEGVRVVYATAPQYRAPVMYPQGLVLLIQGQKVGTIGERSFENTPEQSLLITTSSAIECETFATPEAPLMGLYLSLDALMISELVDKIKEHRGADYFQGGSQQGIEVVAREPALDQCILRLLQALQTPMDSALLGPQYLREIYYLLLTGPQRHVLASFCQQDHTLSRIIRAIEHIQAHCEQKLTIESLASLAEMSVSAFHRAFKQSVEDSPLQYLKKVRLNKAKSLIVHQGFSASAAAYAVGYESATQFSREFKRYFGLPPSRAAEIGSKVQVSDASSLSQ